MRIYRRRSGGLFTPQREYEFESGRPTSIDPLTAPWKYCQRWETTTITRTIKSAKRPKGDAMRAEEV